MCLLFVFRNEVTKVVGFWAVIWGGGSWGIGFEMFKWIQTQQV